MKRHSPRLFRLVLAGLAFLTGSLAAVPREWTDATGRKITAEYISADAGQVTLSINGKEYKMPVEKFSEADQAYIKVVASKPAAPPAGTDAPARAAAPGKVIGPVAAEGSSYYYYVPSSVKPGRKVPMLIYMGAGGGNEGTVKEMIEGAEICGWIVATSVESQNTSNEQQLHVKRAVDDLLKTQPIDPKRLYFSGHSGGARVAFTAGDTYNAAGILAFIAGASGEKDQTPRSRNYFIISGATDFNRYDTAGTFAKVRKISAYRMHPGSHDKGPGYLMTEGMVWLQSAWDVRNPAKSPERDEFEAAVITWIRKIKVAEPHRAAWWAQYFKTQGMTPAHQTEIVALDAELAQSPVNVAYINGIAAIEDFAADVLSKEPSYTKNGHTSPEIQKKAGKLAVDYAAMPWIRDIAEALKKPTGG